MELGRERRPLGDDDGPEEEGLPRPVAVEPRADLREGYASREEKKKSRRRTGTGLATYA